MTKDEYMRELATLQTDSSALSQEPRETSTNECMTMVYPTIFCEDAISRKSVLSVIDGWYEQNRDTENIEDLIILITYMSSVTPSRHKGHCKDCKYFELDHWAEINGVPVICAHEICTKWCSGAKTSSDGYCHLFEEMESEG